jgi:hypothetical protein
MYPLPRGRPRLAWVIPVDMAELGASLQAISNTMPQVNVLRLCHRFRDSPLSRLPQELLDQVIGDIQQSAKADCRSEWYQDSVCWQGTCLPEDHFSIYNEDLEKLWQRIFVEKAYGGTQDLKTEDVTKEKKVEMVHGWVCGDPVFSDIDAWLDRHYEAFSRWLDRTCL